MYQKELSNVCTAVEQSSGFSPSTMIHMNIAFDPIMVLCMLPKLSPVLDRLPLPGVYNFTPFKSSAPSGEPDA